MIEGLAGEGQRRGLSAGGRGESASKGRGMQEGTVNDEESRPQTRITGEREWWDVRDGGRKVR